jgi:tetratricopeptide (TPR) repeat protein
MMARTSGASPNTSIVIKGGLRKQLSIAEEFKAQGNSYFVSLEYSKAIDCYNKCLKAIDDFPTANAAADNEMRKLVLSNRSQAYLKLKVHQKAYDDAHAALQIDY